MRLEEAMALNGSAEITGKFKQHPGYHLPFDVYVKFVVAEKLFNPNEQSFPTGGYVAPGTYKAVLVPVTRLPVPGGTVIECFRDLTKCEHYIQSRLTDYDPDGWHPSSGMIINPYVRTNSEHWEDCE